MNSFLIHDEYIFRLVEDLDLSEKVLFLPSIDLVQKELLLRNATCILYTPENEHFGIVPLEAMKFRKPVIACRSGGPLETVIHGVTGFLCTGTPEVSWKIYFYLRGLSCVKSFANAMETLAARPEYTKRLGEAAARHFQDNFSSDVFCTHVRELVNSLTVRFAAAKCRTRPFSSQMTVCVSILLTVFLFFTMSALTI